MKVVIDDKIPYIREAASQLFDEVVYLPGANFGESEEVKDADALIVRTRTRCDRHLLEGSSVKYIATATIGFDHIDADYLDQAGIKWTNCPGCNASSVGQYVRSSLVVLARKNNLNLAKLCVGIVGFGHVGKEVLKAVESLGCRILLNDPPLQEEKDCNVEFVSLDEIASCCDVITFHTPLTREGKHPTYHLANEAFFYLLKNKPIIINAARGGVVDESALLKAYENDKVSEMVIDTWENEPAISSILLDKAIIATPHIAGYSADGKSNATRMSLRAVCRHFGIGIKSEDDFLRMTAAPLLPENVKPVGNALDDYLILYNPLEDTKRLKDSPDKFEYQRGNYPLRRESF